MTQMIIDSGIVVVGNDGNLGTVNINNYIDACDKTNKLGLSPSDISILKSNTEFKAVIGRNIENARSSLTDNATTNNGLIKKAIEDAIDNYNVVKNKYSTENIIAGALGMTTVDANKFELIKSPYNPNKQNQEIIQKKYNEEVSTRLTTTTPYITGRGPGSDRTPMQEIITGSDLSVFFIAEVYKVEDVVEFANKPWLWRKDLVMMELDTAMSISYSLLREVFPVRTTGLSKPKGFTRGPASCSGHITFAVFTEDVLDRLRTQMITGIEQARDKAKSIADAKTKDADTKTKGSIDAKVATDDATNATTASVQLFQQNILYEKILRENSVYLLNQLGPFNLLVMGVNETGVFSKMMIKGVRIIDENQMQGVFQPNIVNKVTFAAEDIVPMTSINANSNSDSTASKDMGKFGGNNLSVFTGSDVMQSVEYMTRNSSSTVMSEMRNF